MRTWQVITNRRCNQNCVYCTARAETDELAQIHPRVLRSRIDEAVKGGASEVVFSGGEPLLRRDLVELVAHSRSSGATSVVLETNATKVTSDLAAALRDAGLSLVRINLSGWGPGLDAVTRDPGGFEKTLLGLRTFVEAGVEVEVQATLVRSTRDLLPLVPEGLSDALGEGLPSVRAILVTVPVRSPDADELLDYAQIIEPLLALDRRARALGLAVRFAPGEIPPPCVFPSGSRAAHLYSLNAGAAKRQGHGRVDACERCLAADRCPGFPDDYLATQGAPAPTPIEEERVRRRLTIISSPREQARREFVTWNFRPNDACSEDAIIRVNFHCNQSCEFCFVSTHLPSEPESRVREAIAEAAARGARIVLSGGEPTLNPRLAEYVELAARSSSFPVQIQTNATRLDDRSVEDLVKAGLAEAFISLHASTAEVSDRLTGAPGTYVKTLAGIDALARSPVRVLLNFVICRPNMAQLPSFMRLVGERWPDALVSLSFVAPSTDLVPRDVALIPRYSEVLPFLTEALEEARRLGVKIDPFQSQCGLPLCLSPLGLESDDVEVPEESAAGEFTRAPACDHCAMRHRCWGIRRSYAELYGTDELRAVQLATAAS